MSPTVPSVYFLTVEDCCKVSVNILASFFSGEAMALSASFWLRHCMQNSNLNGARIIAMNLTRNEW